MTKVPCVPNLTGHKRPIGEGECLADVLHELADDEVACLKKLWFLGLDDFLGLVEISVMSIRLTLITITDNYYDAQTSREHQQHFC